MLVGFLFDGDHSFVCTWSGSLLLVFGIFAVGDLRLEDGVLAGRIELFLAQFCIVVDPRAWVLVPGLIIVLLFMIFE